LSHESSGAHLDNAVSRGGPGPHRNRQTVDRARLVRRNDLARFALPFEVSALPLQPSPEHPQRESQEDDDCGADQEDPHAIQLSHRADGPAPHGVSPTMGRGGSPSQYLAGKGRVALGAQRRRVQPLSSRPARGARGGDPPAPACSRPSGPRAWAIDRETRRPRLASRVPAACGNSLLDAPGWPARAGVCFAATDQLSHCLSLPTMRSSPWRAPRLFGRSAAQAAPAASLPRPASGMPTAIEPSSQTATRRRPAALAP
jgi:hypothetical protein